MRFGREPPFLYSRAHGTHIPKRYITKEQDGTVLLVTLLRRYFDRYACANFRHGRKWNLALGPFAW
jgi:hypothetical protein